MYLCKLLQNHLFVPYKSVFDWLLHICCYISEWRIACLVLYSVWMIGLYISPLFIRSPCLIARDKLLPRPQLFAHRGAMAVSQYGLFYLCYKDYIYEYICQVFMFRAVLSVLLD